MFRLGGWGAGTKVLRPHLIRHSPYSDTRRPTPKIMQNKHLHIQPHSQQCCWPSSHAKRDLHFAICLAYLRKIAELQKRQKKAQMRKIKQTCTCMLHKQSIVELKKAL